MLRRFHSRRTMPSVSGLQASLQANKLHRRPPLAEQLELTEEKKESYLQTGFWAFVSVAILLHFWPGLVAPYNLFSLWHTSGNVPQWLLVSWPIFAWGFGFTALVSVLTKNKAESNRLAEVHLVRGFFVSIFAGLFEEICFRWLIFLNAIIGALIINWLFFGWAGFGILQWLQIHLFGPVVNFLSLGLLHDQLTNPGMWAIGFALISANAAFRDGHKYLGVVGYINSWFIGLFFFYLMFHFGLPAAILVHFLYDAGIFLIRYIDEATERAFQKE